MGYGEAYVVQCMGCGSLMALTDAISTRPLTELGASPGCVSKRWNLHHVRIGAFSAHGARLFVDAAEDVTRRHPGQHPRLEAEIAQAEFSTGQYAVWNADPNGDCDQRGPIVGYPR